MYSKYGFNEFINTTLINKNDVVRKLFIINGTSSTNTLDLICDKSQQALIKKLLSKALNGELGALKTLTNLIALHLKVSEADIDELLDEDVKLFDKYYVERKGGTKNDN